MRKVIISLLFVIFSLIGIADATYLTYEKLVGTAVVCGSGFDCGQVLSSKWAMIGPIPLSAFGMIFYITLFIFSCLHLVELNLKPHLLKLAKKFPFLDFPAFLNIKTHEIVFLLSFFGFLFSIYLVSIMAFVIKAWCLYCLVSAATSTTIFLLSVYYHSQTRDKEKIFLKSAFYFLCDFFYTFFLKRIFFLFDPTFIHNTLVYFGKSITQYKLGRNVLTMFFSFNDVALTEVHTNILFTNPVGLAAGFDYNGDLTNATKSLGFGFHTIGTVTLESFQGNPHPQLVRLPKSRSILVNKGLKNNGAKKIIEQLEKTTFEIPTGISIASTNKAYPTIQSQIIDICRCFYLFEKSSVPHAYYELNISCPNTFGGEPFTTPKRLRILIKVLAKMKISKPIFVKMPIDLTNRETLALLSILNTSFVSGVIFGNLSKDKNNPAIVSPEQELVKKYQGNLSGKPTWNRSNELISLTKSMYGKRFVIIGTGGVFSPEDALIKLNLGADLVQLITGMIFTGPQLIGKINCQLYTQNKIETST